jgi:flagellar basal body rod protein FlgG
MSHGIYVALSGAVAQETSLETTATNLANVGTPGYQRLRPVFREVLAGARARGPSLHYTAVDGTKLEGGRGAIKATGRGLDVALPEGVYLAVTTPRGERYTRAGSLTVAADGTLTTAGGTPLAREDGSPIKVSPGTEARIAADGGVTQGGSEVARLRLVRFEKDAALSHEGAGLVAAQGSPAPATDAVLEPGALEESNATVVSAMTDLVTASRTFEAFQKILDTMGEADRKVLTTVPSTQD